MDALNLHSTGVRYNYPVQVNFHCHSQHAPDILLPSVKTALLRIELEIGSTKSDEYMV